MALETQSGTRSSSVAHRMQTRSVTRPQGHGATKDLIRTVNKQAVELLENASASNMYEFLGNGSTPSNLNLSSTSSDADVTAVNRNLNHPFINVAGFTATAYWNNRQGQARHGTLITPQHVVAVDHYHLATNGQAGTYSGNSFTVGDKLAFKDNKNNTYFRTVIGVSDAMAGFSCILFGGDTEVSTLNEPLPDSIQPMKILPTKWWRHCDVEEGQVRYQSRYAVAQTGQQINEIITEKRDTRFTQPIHMFFKNRFSQWGLLPSFNMSASTILPSFGTMSDRTITVKQGSATNSNATERWSFDFVRSIKKAQHGPSESLAVVNLMRDAHEVNPLSHIPDPGIMPGTSGCPRVMIIDNQMILVGLITTAGGGSAFGSTADYWGPEANGFLDPFYNFSTRTNPNTYTTTHDKTTTILTTIVAADAMGGVNTGYKPEAFNFSNQFVKTKFDPHRKVLPLFKAIEEVHLLFHATNKTPEGNAAAIAAYGTDTGTVYTIATENFMNYSIPRSDYE